MSRRESSVIAVPVRQDAAVADLPLPAYQTAGSAGLDLRAAVDAPVMLEPGDRSRVPTGISLALPIGFEAQVRPRSGLADRHGLTVLNTPGTIDSDYRGEIQVILINLGRESVTIARGDRIGQLVVSPVSRVTWREVAELPSTCRGSDGFGSTGSAS